MRELRPGEPLHAPQTTGRAGGVVRLEAGKRPLDRRNRPRSACFAPFRRKTCRTALCLRCPRPISYLRRASLALFARKSVGTSSCCPRIRPVDSYSPVLTGPDSERAVDTYAVICCGAYHPYGSTVTSRSVSPSLLWYQHVTSNLPRGSSRAHRPKEAFWASLFGSSRYSNRINHEAQVGEV